MSSTSDLDGPPPTGSPALGRATSPTVATRTPVLLLPLGSTEQHGPHLPLDTDTRIATAVAQAAAVALLAGRLDTIVAPALPYGAAGEHAGFAGTLSLGRDALRAALVELVRSADHFRAVVFVCGHGGNAEPAREAASTLTSEGRRVVAWFPAVPGGDAHAGHTETSLMLHLAPELVDRARAEPGATAPLAELIGELRAAGVRAVSPNGVLGDPTGATADHGRVLFDRLAHDLAAAVRALVAAR